VFNERFIRIAVWVLAMILPGGFMLLALWESNRALKARASLRPRAPVQRLSSQAVGT